MIGATEMTDFMMKVLKGIEIKSGPGGTQIIGKMNTFVDDLVLWEDKPLLIEAKEGLLG
jgi:hypothetical protein